MKNDVLHVEELHIPSFRENSITRVRINIAPNGLGDFMKIPAIIIRGKFSGPTVGITAAVHGDELNGIPIIHNICKQVKTKTLHGNIIAVPVVNIPGYLNNKRTFRDGSDLNRLFPGKKGGTCGEFYAHEFITKIISKLHYLIDLHTASFGRINSLYVRADLSSSITQKMAQLQNPQIIVHNRGRDGTLRSAAANMGIHAITVEVGNPLRFQKRLIKNSIIGILNVLSNLKMIPRLEKPSGTPIVCKKSYWMYTDKGGLLEVLPDIVDMVQKGEVIARIKNIYGDTIKEYHAKHKGIVVGKSTNPVGNAGARILHLGIPGEVNVL